MFKTNQAVGGRGGGGSIGRSILEVDGKKRLPLCSKRTRLLGEGERGGSIGRSLLEVDGKKRLPLCSKRTRLLGEGEGGGSIGRSLLEADGKKRLPLCSKRTRLLGEGEGGVALEGVFWRWMVRNVYVVFKRNPAVGEGERRGFSVGRSLLEVDGKKRLPLCSKRTRLLGEGKGGGGVALEGVFWRWMVRNVYVVFKTNQAVGGRGGGGVALEGVFWRRMVRNVYVVFKRNQAVGEGERRGFSVGRSLLEVDGKKRLPLCSKRTRLLGEGEGGG